MLEVKHLTVTIGGDRVVNDVTFTVGEGEKVGMVGESGSGKSMTALAVSGLLPADSQASGTITFWGKQFLAGRTQEASWRQIRGKGLGIVFQDPAASLNPLIPVGRQVREVLRFHQGLPAKEADRETARLFSSLGLFPIEKRMSQYPHQLSGGMKQRVMLAAAICCNPKLVIADEPTTALDVTVQAQIICLLREITRKAGTSLLLISHDLAVIAQLAQRVLVMCAGVVVEEAPVRELFAQPCHPYTRLLLESVPRLDKRSGVRIREEPEIVLSSSCVFATRCSRRGCCCRQPPPLIRIGRGHTVRCHYRW